MIDEAVAPDFVLKEGDAKDDTVVAHRKHLFNDVGSAHVDFRNLLTSNKLFILIAKTCNFYDRLADDHARIKVVGNMPTQKKSRAGIQERTYKNTLYEILYEEKGQHAEKKSKYAMLEYATPVLHMYDMAKFGSLTGFTGEDRDAQVVQFYKTLKELIDNEKDIRIQVKLVLLKDPKVNMEEIILKSIGEA